MSEEPSRREQAAYRLAATGVTAIAYDVTVEELRLSADFEDGYNAKLAPLDAAILATDTLSSEQRRCVQDYVTVLLADGPGRLIWQERIGSDRGTQISPKLLRRRRLADALNASSCSSDRALALVVALLQPYNMAQAKARVEELWLRANRLLRSPPHAKRLVRLASELLVERKLPGDKLSYLLDNLRSSE